MNASEALMASNAIRNRAIGQQRIGVTDLARSTSWRKKLAENKMIEIVDRGSTVGWLLSDEGLSSLLETISYFESEAERTQVAYVVEMREGYREWSSGDSLRKQIAEGAEDVLADLEASFYHD